ncbi:TMEM165/GDT1 family protein [Mycobacterium sp. NPDC050853]|uniref:TMEM165/GDT1 family protein n=1 Tax=Mycobacteriaceae TaxID=1762 RepID=UPI0015DF99FF|nr:TMEM165/GDT1 family protein [Mycobacteroides sp. LB1]
MLSAAAVSFGVVFLAELGDRSQLMAMTYALRYRWWMVLSGIAVSSVVVHGLSVAVGHFLGATLPERPIAFCAGLAFLGFAIWTWRENNANNGGEPATARTTRFAFLAIISSFVLAELGDKTMLATVALASDHQWNGVWLGSTTGMVCADAVAILVGALLHRSLPAHLLQNIASVLFAIFGFWMIFDGALGLRWVAVTLIGFTMVAVILITVRRRRFTAGQRGCPADGHTCGRRSTI